MKVQFILILLLAFITFSCVQSPGTPTVVPPLKKEVAKTVSATYYGHGDGFAGKTTASGEKMNPNALTAASPDLPLGSKVKVTDKKTGKSTVVTINDRQPKKRKPSIDLSKRAADEIGITERGRADVEIKPIKE